MVKISGVYAIRNQANGKMIIGSAKDIRRRWSNYFSLLRHGKYGNRALQADWDEYGEESFERIILEETKITELFEREQYWMDAHWDKGILYNKHRQRKTKKKIRRGREAAKHREKMSIVNSGQNNPRHRGLLMEEDVRAIKTLIDSGMGNIEIHRLFEEKTSKTMISRIRIGDRYKRVQI